MKPEWFCADCRDTTDLNRHGYCSRCGSDAVDIAVRPRITTEGMISAFLTTEELEKLYEKS